MSATCLLHPTSSLGMRTAKQMAIRWRWGLTPTIRTPNSRWRWVAHRPPTTAIITTKTQGNASLALVGTGTAARTPGLGSGPCSMRLRARACTWAGGFSKPLGRGGPGDPSPGNILVNRICLGFGALARSRWWELEPRRERRALVMGPAQCVFARARELGRADSHWRNNIPLRPTLHTPW